MTSIWVCPKCRAVNPSEWDTCWFCGYKVKVIKKGGN